VRAAARGAVRALSVLVECAASARRGACGIACPQLATSYIAADLATELPVLAARDTGPGGIYDRMEEAGFGPIRWTEAITTRPPSPTEASRLGLAPGVALLRIVRLASSPADRALEVNDTRMSGDEFEISYPLSRDASASQPT